MATTIKDRKRPEYSKIAGRKGQRLEIKAGVLERDADKEHPDAKGLTVGDLATIHEFGAPDQNIPERSFIRAWFDGHQTEILLMLRDQYARAAKGEITYEQAAQRVSLWAKASIVQRIRAHIEPPLKQATIDRKGSSTPLIDRGILVASISAQVTPKE